MRNLFLALAAATTLAWSPAMAVTFTGNPDDDGWTQTGNSREVGTFARDANGRYFNFDVFRYDGVLSADLSATFLAGDRLIGFGGVCNGAIEGSTSNQCSVNTVSKFGGPNETFGPASTITGTDGNAATADGGVGSIYVGTTHTGALENVRRWNGTAYVAIANPNNYVLAFSDIVLDSSPTPIARYRSWEVLLNIDALARAGFTDIPEVTSAGITSMAIHRPGGSGYTDAFVPGGPVGVVPEPATWGLMIGGFGLAGAALRRRRALHA